MDTFGGIVPTEEFQRFREFWAACAKSDVADIVLVSQSQDFSKLPPGESALERQVG